jgi:hypothetical protein
MNDDDDRALCATLAGLLRAGGLLTDDEVRRVAHIAVQEVAA